ncbi:hypothetical protein [Anabaena catenula]|uniref:Uncharacterized protein n=1 Tax=Anabaena catenula FACHB-362 TaxID=2692877 RepID=A0ABR8J3D0_9NOST|nr:hypothetical protein [Anabaena catenula]MBD2692650.1 hypothetical protein [Anabaena catenula FACHB-362]
MTQTSSSNQSIQRSLLPYDDDYVLIRKRTLVVNTATTSQMAEFLSQKCDVSADDMAAFFGIPIIGYVDGLPDDKVSAIVGDLIAESWRNQDNEQSRTVVVIENKENK